MLQRRADPEPKPRRKMRSASHTHAALVADWLGGEDQSTYLRGRSFGTSFTGNMALDRSIFQHDTGKGSCMEATF